VGRAADSAAIVARVNQGGAPVRATRLARADPLQATVALACAFVAVVATIGADARWLPALGREIVDRGGIPTGVPFASALSGDWPNVPVLAELILHGLTAALGDRGFLLAQLVAVTAALVVLAVDMRRGGAGDLGSSLAIVLVVVGAIPALLVIRVQLFSLLLFPLLAALLRAQARNPSRRIWLVPPLLALWSNLHGAVLVGLIVAATYLVLDRARSEPLLAIAVLAASGLAVCLTPALERTPAYYLGVLRNEAARRGEGLWAPLTLHSGFDLLLIVAGALLLAGALRTRPPMWETLVLVALAVLTVKTARSGVWLLFFAAPLAARVPRARSCRRWPLVVPFAVVLAVFGIIQGPSPSGADNRLLHDALLRAAGTPILAEPILAEQVALAGGRVWMSNPLDAFSGADQQLYLEWLDGQPDGLRALDYAPRAVLVRPGSHASALTARSVGWREVGRGPEAVLYVRRR
jgi:hypothetical protein